MNVSAGRAADVERIVEAGIGELADVGNRQQRAFVDDLVRRDRSSVGATLLTVTWNVALSTPPSSSVTVTVTV